MCTNGRHDTALEDVRDEGADLIEARLEDCRRNAVALDGDIGANPSHGLRELVLGDGKVDAQKDPAQKHESRLVRCASGCSPYGEDWAVDVTLHAFGTGANIASQCAESTSTNEAKYYCPRQWRATRALCSAVVHKEPLAAVRSTELRAIEATLRLAQGNLRIGVLSIADQMNKLANRGTLAG